MPEIVAILIGLVVGVGLGAIAGVLFSRSKSAAAETQSAQTIARLETSLDTQQQAFAERLESQEQSFTEREALIRQNNEEAQDRIRKDQAALREQFEALATDALDRNNKRFLNVANEQLKNQQNESKAELEKRETAFRNLVEPMKETLSKVEKQATEAEKQRALTQESLTQQIRQMMEKSDELGKSTESLRSALRRPEVRGRWGELHLRRVVEVSGLVNGVDFVEQSSNTDEEGKRLQPDMIVTLSGGRKIVVDAKAPLDAILDIDTDPANAEHHAQRHVSNVRNRVKELKSKKYREQFDSSIDFSVLFLPAESFLQVATEQDPHLLTDAYDDGIIIATPTVLVAMLRTVAHTWKAESLAQNAQEVLDTGKQLYDSLSTMGSHLESLGKRIDSASDAYNKTLGSLERNVLPKARKLSTLQELEDPIELSRTEKNVREINAPELVVSEPELAELEKPEELDVR
ncbi:MAG: DNA recombination protein RmuC [Candidatus Nanopelagicales bacterium]